MHLILHRFLNGKYLRAPLERTICFLVLLGIIFIFVAPTRGFVPAAVSIIAIRLLKHIVRCYLRLSDNLRAREALRQCLPDALRDHTFAAHIKDDLTVQRWLSSLLYNISEQAIADMQAQRS